MKRILLIAALAAMVSTAIARAESALAPLKGAVYGAAGPIAVALVHGDVSRGGPADYLYRVAEEIARKHNVQAAAILRPGYKDSNGQRSKGSNNGRRDHYTARNNTLLTEALSAFKDGAGAQTLIVIAHSGGAAQTGVILGQTPGLIDKAILVGCPCDVPTWRKRRKRGAWENSQSPHDFADTVPADAEILLLTGSKDGSTPGYLAKAYAKASPARATARIIRGAGHNFREMRAAVMQGLAELL